MPTLIVGARRYATYVVLRADQRKTIYCRDVVTSMSEHPNPESMQIFVGEWCACLYAALIA